MTEQNFDLIVIGAGPGGYVAAIRAAQLGMQVACIEKEKTLGGTCLNIGCIPSKALLESSELYAEAQNKFKDHGIELKDLSLNLPQFMARKDQVVNQLTKGVEGLFKKNKITRFSGTAQVRKDKTVLIRQSDGTTLELQSKNIIIATGSIPIELPFLKINQKNIVDSTGALSLSFIPKKMIVIGGGYIGLELGSVYLRLGSEVTVVEALDKIVPMMDEEVGKSLQRILQRQGMKFQLSSKVKKVEEKKELIQVTIEDPKKGELLLEADCLLVSVGRKPMTEGLGLKEAGIQVDQKGRIETNDRFGTSLDGIYAIGDVARGPMLAHKASEEGVAVAEIIAGQAGHVNYNTIPSVIYTHPEVASVGMTEEEAKLKNIDYKTSKFPFLANGRALALGDKEGFVKLIADKKTDRLLGAHILGPRASDLIAELVLGMEFSTSAEDIARTIHAHPTLAEAVKEAALGLGDGAIHS